MNVQKINELKSRIDEVSTGTALVLNVIDFVDTISEKTNGKVTDEQHKMLVMTFSYLLAKKTI